MNLTYPKNSKAGEKLAYALAMQEKLRLWHNQQGATLVLSEFRQWVDDEFDPRQSFVLEDVAELKQLVKAEHTAFNVKAEDIPKRMIISGN